ncbi:hypothetical protein EC988_000045 [Linderina pennispora]|nr:hypothetical protein EC988_000045 [Linderina pennispora]
MLAVDNSDERRRLSAAAAAAVDGTITNQQQQQQLVQQTTRASCVAYSSRQDSGGRTKKWAALALVAMLAVFTPALAADSTSTSLTTPTPKATAVRGPTHASQSESGSESESMDELGEIDEVSGKAGSSNTTNGGSIGIVGGFRGVSLYTGNTGGATLKLDSTVSSIISLSQDTVSFLSNAPSDGDITAACAFYNSDGSVSQVFVGGSSLSKVNSTDVSYVAGISASGKIDSMQGGVNGPVNALYCDQDKQVVYVGGNFTTTTAATLKSVSTSDSAATGHLVLYDVAASNWRTLPFSGLDGPVYAFGRTRDYVFAAGEFSATVDNATHVSLGTQPVNLTACTITGGNNAETFGFGDPHNAICTKRLDTVGNTWLMRDKLTGFFRIDFPFRTTPSLLRLINTMYQGRGTKSFRVEAASTNLALRMAYMDSALGAEVICVQSCPLNHDYSWQDFRFADDSATVANLTGVNIVVTDWYGEGGGFNKVELYQRDPRVYVDSSFNGSPCSQQAIQPTSNMVGDWKPTSPSSYHGTYRTLTVNVGDVDSATTQNSQVRLYPSIPEAGFYNIYMMIPGCENTNTCIRRASAKVTLGMTRSQEVVATVGQHNFVDQEVLVYRGYTPASTSNFAMSVSVGIVSDAKVSPQTTQVEAVVDYFRFERTTSYTDLRGVMRLYTDLDSELQTYGPLYMPLNDTLPEQAVVYSVAADASDKSGDVYLGGNFANQTSGYEGVVQYKDNKLQPLNNTGVLGSVSALVLNGKSLFVGGQFNGTGDKKVAFSNIAQYNTSDSQWYPLAGGVNGAVTHMVPYAPFGSDIVAVTGSYAQLLADPRVPKSENVAVSPLIMWNTTAGEWVATPYVEGTPTLVFSDAWNKSRPNQAGLIAGKFSAAAAISAGGTLLLDSDSSVRSLEYVGYSLRPTANQAFAVNTGLWYAKSNGTAAKLIVGGQFTTADGSTNIAQLDQGRWRKLVSGVNGEVLTLANAAKFLFIGGKANLTTSSSSQKTTGFMGLTVYDMDSGDTMSMPRFMAASGSTTQVKINKVAVRANTAQVIVGGDFQLSGSLSCPYVCSWDINDAQWSPLASSSLTGPVTDMLFVGSQLVVAGTFQNGSQPIQYLMHYNFDKSAWEEVADVASLPGPAAVLAPVAATGDTKSFFVAGADRSSGKSYLARFDGTSFTKLSVNLGSNSSIRGVTLTPLSRIPASVLSASARSALSRRADGESAIPSGYALSISGDLVLSGNKRASSAFFDGSKWAPFLSTVQSDGSAGYVSSFFYENPPLSVYEKKLMSTALVILIAVVIALGITFLIVLVGLAYVYFRNRREAAATASAAAAAIAAAAAGGAGTMKPPQMLAKSATGTGYLHGSGMGAAGFSVGAGAMAAATGDLGDDDDRPRHAAAAAGDRDTWDEDALMAASELRYNNMASKTGRVASGSSTGLAGLATAAGRQAAVSSDTYVDKHGNVGAGDQTRGIPDDSLDSIFESAAAEAEAEQAATTAAVAAAAAAASNEKSGSHGYAMPAPHHYDQRGNELSQQQAENELSSIKAKAGSPQPAGAASLAAPIPRSLAMPAPATDLLSGSDDGGMTSSYGSRSSMYRPDSTNPFEQRLALRESHGAFPPAGPFAAEAGDTSSAYIPMPTPRHQDSEQAAAAVLAGATVTTAAAAAAATAAATTAAAAALPGAVASKKNNSKDSGSEPESESESAAAAIRRRSLSAASSSADTSNGRSDASGPREPLPIRDSLRQYPVFYAKFTFSSRETGELGFRAGERVFVIDQSDEIWWMGIVDHGADQPLEQGVFPATYVSDTPPKTTEWAELM